MYCSISVHRSVVWSKIGVRHQRHNTQPPDGGEFGRYRSSHDLFERDIDKRRARSLYDPDANFACWHQAGELSRECQTLSAVTTSIATRADRSTRLGLRTGSSARSSETHK